MPIKLERIGHCALRVRDVERSKEFYTQVLGFQLMEQDPEHGGVFMSLPQDGHTLDLSPVDDPETALPPLHARDGVGIRHFAGLTDCPEAPSLPYTAQTASPASPPKHVCLCVNLVDRHPVPLVHGA